MTAPFWMEAAQGWLGVHEDEDRADEIGRLYAQATGQKVFDPEDTPWCSIFIGAMLGKQFDLTGITPLVKSWLGLKGAKKISIDDAQYGDIVVLDRTVDPKFGHGGFFVGASKKYIQILGGNQGDQVSIASFDKSRLAGIVRPVPKDGVVEKPAPTKHDGSDFHRALEVILRHEGGWSDHPHDPGGATNFGITIETFRNWRRMRGFASATEEQLRELSREEAEQIYQTLYWQAAKCDSLESYAMRLMHFDTAVNQGVGRAIRFLQMALGVEVDGQFGPETSAAEDKANQGAILTEYAARRMNHYGTLSKFSVFGLGWSRRLMRTLTTAYADLGSPQTTHKQPAEQRAPAATIWDDPAIQDLAARGTVSMLGLFFRLIERYFNFANGWKTWAGIGLFALNYLAAAYGITAELPAGEAGGFIGRIIEMIAGNMGIVAQAGAIAGSSLFGVGFAHKAYKAGKES